MNSRNVIWIICLIVIIGCMALGLAHVVQGTELQKSIVDGCSKSDAVENNGICPDNWIETYYTRK